MRKERKGVAMKIKKWIFWLIINPMPIYIVVAVFIWCFGWRFVPLLPNTQWQVEARTHDGRPLSVETCKMLWRDVLFMRVEGGPDALLSTPPWLDLDDRPVRWFAVDFTDSRKDWHAQKGDKVHVCRAYFEKSPCLNACMDWHYGLDIFTLKPDREPWLLHYTETSAVFSNGAFAVFVFQKNSPRPPVSEYTTSWRGKGFVDMPRMGD